MVHDFIIPIDHMKKLLYKFFARFQSPKAKLITTILLLISGILELRETGLEEFLNIEVRIHYGIIIYCMTMIFESIANIVDQSQKI